MNLTSFTQSSSLTQSITLLIIWLIGLWIARPLAERWLLTIIKKVQSKSNRSQKEKDQRAQTIVTVLSTTIIVGVTTAFAFVGLSAFGFNIAPLLAGAGVVGFAIGFGSQSLVKDIINGLFIVIEDQLGVGDIVEISGIQGKVEQFNLRRTVLRDQQGVAHYLPNSRVNTVANLSQDWAFLLIHIKVSIDQDPDKIIKLLNQITSKFIADPQFKDLFHDNLEVDGLEELGGGTMTFRVRAKVEGGSQWKLKRQFLIHIHQQFTKQGIELK